MTADQKYNQRLKQAGLCRYCRSVAVSGRRLCESCATKETKRVREWKEKNGLVVWFDGLPPRATLPEGVCICRVPGCKVDRGFCHCGCGKKTSLARTTEWSKGYIKGEPKAFWVGHQNRVITEVVDAKPFKIEGVYCRLIPLTLGLYAIVNESDYLWLMQWKWHAHRNDKGGGWYAKRSELMDDGKYHSIRMHRQILGLEFKDRRLGDHVETGLTLHNYRKNLRISEPWQNSMNARIRSDNKSGYKGVSKAKGGKWKAEIRVRGILYRLGIFDTKLEAHAAYCEAAVRLAGEFARAA